VSHRSVQILWISRTEFRAGTSFTLSRRISVEVSVWLLVCLNSRPKKTWREIVEKDCQARKLNREDAVDRNRWRKQIREN